jgi:aryl-alcohol dehydrogenase-like predicted oxidoreductase
MQYKKLGRTDLKVSAICLGTMTWGNQNTQNDGHAQMDYALKRGINFFDTAEMYAVPPSPETYGRTEDIIGTWFAARKNRDKVVLATKIAGPGLPWVRGGRAFIDRDNLHAALEASLKRLRTDYIDLYQLHWPNRGSYHFSQHWTYTPDFNAVEVEENFIEVLETLAGLIRDGKIRHIGLSNETAWGAMKWLHLADKHGLPRMVSIQNEYSLACRLADTDMQEIVRHEDLSFLAWSPLARGMLSGKYLDGARPPGTRLVLETRPERRDTPEMNEAVRAYLAVAEKYKLDPCQMALAFVSERPFVTSNIIGATSLKQLKSDIDSMNVSLKPAILEDLEKVRRQFPIPY